MHRPVEEAEPQSGGSRGSSRPGLDKRIAPDKRAAFVVANKRRQVPEWLAYAAAIGWRVLVVGAAVHYGAIFIARLNIVVVPLLLAVFVTALLEPAANVFDRVLPRSIAALFAILLGLGVLGGALTILGFGIAGQISEAADALDRGWRQLVELVRGSPFGQGKDTLSDLLSSFADQLRSRIGGIASGVASGAQSVFLFVSELLLTLVFAFFFLRDGRSLFDRVAHRLSESGEAKAQRTGSRAWYTLGRYLRGLALIALLNSLMKGGALLVLSVPMIVPIMILMFIGSFIPFAGPIIAGAVASLVALADEGLVTALLVVLASFGIQIVEGNVLQPYIMGRAMNIHPVLILAGVAIGAILAGLAGAFLAVPLLAIAKATIPGLRSPRSDSGGNSGSDTDSHENGDQNHE